MRKEIDITKKPTSEQIAQLLKAKEMPIPEDSEYPEFSEEDLLQFARIKNEKNISRQKQTVTLRLSSQTLAKAKSLGKGYTSVLSRIIESALDNPETVKRYL